MPALVKGLRNIKTMSNRLDKVQSPHEAFISAAALHREKQRHLQELAILRNRLDEINLRLEQINEQQNQVAEAFDISPPRAVKSALRTGIQSKTGSTSHGFKIKY